MLLTIPTATATTTTTNNNNNDNTIDNISNNNIAYI